MDLIDNQMQTYLIEHHATYMKDQSFPLFDANWKASPKLIELLNLVGMDVSSETNCTIEKINAWAQKNLLRKGERWEEQSDRFEALKPKLFPLFQDLGFIHASTPQSTYYEGAIVLGSSLPSLRSRLFHLVQKWQEGVRFKTLYFLGGARPLEPAFEGREALLNDESTPLKIRKDWEGMQAIPQTECEMIKLVWEQSEIPDDMRKSVAVSFIDAPMKYLPNVEKPERPTTEDTVYYWLMENPELGSYLAVSNGAHKLRQHVMLQSLVGSAYAIDTIGSATQDGTKMVIILDELARLIFQLQKIAIRAIPNPSY